MIQRTLGWNFKGRDVFSIQDGHLGGYMQGGDPGTWTPNLWEWMVQEFEIRSVLDVGCGEGQSTRFFHDLGCSVLGVDGCPQAILDSVLPGHVVRHDFADGPFNPPGQFDLVWSCEFVEHVEAHYVPHFLETFSSARRFLLLTYAEPGQGGHHHVHLQPAEYWINLMQTIGLTHDPDLTRQARRIACGEECPYNHFARKGLVFRRKSPEGRTA